MLFNLESNKISLKSRRKHDATLSEFVRLCVDNYFSRLNGHPAKGIYDMVIREIEKPLIEAVLKHSQQNQSKASEALGISRSTLRKKMNLYNIG